MHLKPEYLIVLSRPSSPKVKKNLNSTATSKYIIKIYCQVARLKNKKNPFHLQNTKFFLIRSHIEKLYSFANSINESFRQSHK